MTFSYHYISTLRTVIPTALWYVNIPPPSAATSCSHKIVHSCICIFAPPPPPHGRRHAGQGLRPGAPASPDGGEGCGPELPACIAGRSRDCFCSPEWTGSAWDTVRSDFQFHDLECITFQVTVSYLGGSMDSSINNNVMYISTEAKFTNFWNLILDEKKPLFTEKFLHQASDGSKATHCPLHHVQCDYKQVPAGMWVTN